MKECNESSILKLIQFIASADGAADLLTPGTHIIMSEYWLLSRKRMLKEPRVAQNQLIRTTSQPLVSWYCCVISSAHTKNKQNKNNDIISLFRM